MINNRLNYRIKHIYTDAFDYFINTTLATNPSTYNYNSSYLIQNYDMMDYNYRDGDTVYLAGAYTNYFTNNVIVGYTKTLGTSNLLYSRVGESYSFISNELSMIGSTNSVRPDDIHFRNGSHGIVFEGDNEIEGTSHYYTEIVASNATLFPRTNINFIGSGFLTINAVLWTEVPTIEPTNVNGEHFVIITGIVDLSGRKKINFYVANSTSNIYHLRYTVNSTDMSSSYVNINLNDLSYTTTNISIDTTIHSVVVTRHKNLINIEIDANNLAHSKLSILNNSMNLIYTPSVTGGLKIGWFSVVDNSLGNRKMKCYQKALGTNKITNTDNLVPLNFTYDSLMYVKSEHLKRHVFFMSGGSTFDLGKSLKDDKLYSISISTLGDIFQAFINNLNTDGTYTYDEDLLYNNWLSIMQNPFFQDAIFSRKGIVVIPFVYKIGYVGGMDLSNGDIVDIEFSREHVNVPQVVGMNTTLTNTDLTTYSEDEIVYDDMLYYSNIGGYLFEDKYEIVGDLVNTSQSLISPQTFLSSSSSELIIRITDLATYTTAPTPSSTVVTIFTGFFKIPSSSNLRIMTQMMNYMDNYETIFFDPNGSSSNITYNNDSIGFFQTVNIIDDWYYVRANSDIFTSQVVDMLFGFDNTPNSINTEYILPQLLYVDSYNISSYPQKMAGVTTYAMSNIYIGNDRLEISAHSPYQVFIKSEKGGEFKVNYQGETITELLGNDKLYAMVLTKQ